MVAWMNAGQTTLTRTPKSTHPTHTSVVGADGAVDTGRQQTEKLGRFIPLTLISGSVSVRIHAMAFCLVI